VPVDLADRTAPPLTVDAAMSLALAQRPELTELEATLAQNAVDIQYAADQTRPRVDAVGTYRLAGLAGTEVATSSTTPSTSMTSAAVVSRLNELALRAGLTPLETTTTPAATLPDFLLGGFGDSLANIWNLRFPTLLVQLQMDLPIRNRTSKANLARAQIVHRQIERQRAQLEQTIEVEVRNALQAVVSSRERLSSAGSAHRNAQEQYDSERRRFESGLSTVFLVLERQTALVTAQAREVRARADLNQAIAELDRAIGATLQRYGIQLGA
jgi:outer membrane protein TolC